MAKVKNVTAMSLGFNGMTIHPGEEIEVDEELANRMIEQPSRFQLVGEAKAATPRNRRE